MTSFRDVSTVGQNPYLSYRQVNNTPNVQICNPALSNQPGLGISSTYGMSAGDSSLSQMMGMIMSMMSMMMMTLFSGLFGNKTELNGKGGKNTPKPETEPQTKPETEPETKPETEPETKPETEPQTRPATKPETGSETKPETEPETTPQTRPENIDPYKTTTKTYTAEGGATWENGKYVKGTLFDQAVADTDLSVVHGSDNRLNAAGYEALVANFTTLADSKGEVTPESINVAIKAGKLTGNGKAVAFWLLNSPDDLNALDGNGDQKFVMSDVTREKEKLTPSSGNDSYKTTTKTYTAEGGATWENGKYVKGTLFDQAVADTDLSVVHGPGNRLNAAGYEALTANFATLADNGLVTPESINKALKGGKLTGNAKALALWLLNSPDDLNALDGNGNKNFNADDVKREKHKFDVQTDLDLIGGTEGVKKVSKGQIIDILNNNNAIHQDPDKFRFWQRVVDYMEDNGNMTEISLEEVLTAEKNGWRPQ